MAMRSARFHGRYEDTGHTCEHPTCQEAGEFRAPGASGNSFDGPGQWRWFCLEHVREFNAGYDWFEGMSADEILAAQSPASGWRTESRAFRGGPGSLGAGVDGMPRWSDYDDPLDAIGARAAGIKSRARREAEMAPNRMGDGRFSPDEAKALEVMGRPRNRPPQLRRRYSELVAGIIQTAMAATEFEKRLTA